MTTRKRIGINPAPTVVVTPPTGGTGPNPSDAVTFKINFPETPNVVPTDGVSLKLVFPDTNAAPSEGMALRINGLGDTNVAPNDLLTKLGITWQDLNNAPTDIGTYLLNLLLADTNAAPTDVFVPKIQFSESSAAPTDANSFVLRAWLSGSTGGTNPTNADGNTPPTGGGAVATIQSALAGSTPVTMTSALGTNIPAAISITSAIYRGWFKVVNTLVTSTSTIILHSTSALFTDIVMYTYSTLNGTDDHLVGNFTFNLGPGSVPNLTVTQLRSAQVLHRTTDAVAGVTPAVMTVDAGALDMAGVF